MATELNVLGEAAVVPTGPCLRLLMPAMLALGNVETREMPLAVAIELASIAGWRGSLGASTRPPWSEEALVSA